jgi:hypothetical protein
VLLSDDVRELLRPVFARQDGVAHEVEDTIIRDARGGWADSDTGQRANFPARIDRRLS